MAEGFLKDMDPELEVFSAGTNPSDRVHPRAIEVMGELGVDLSSNRPENVSEYLDQAFDYVITVCGGAKETCPTFQGKVGRNLHIGFDDPADATGTEEEVLSEFRRIRDEIRRDFGEFYREQVLGQN